MRAVSPSIALVVPCFNASRYLRQLSQVLTAVSPFVTSIILVDDCSTDNTYKEALEMGMKIVKTPKNLGPGGARNFGVQNLDRDCEWIHFHDADDLLSSGGFSECVQNLNNDIDVLLAESDWVEESSRNILARYRFSPQELNRDPLTFSVFSPIPVHCSFVRHSKFIEIGGFDTSLRCWEDGDLHVRLAASGSRFGMVSRILSTSIRHYRGASSNHLICHRCRLRCLRNYLELQLPVGASEMALELLNVGNLLLGEGRITEALHAYHLSCRCHPFRIQSNNPIMRLLVSVLPLHWAILIHHGARQLLGRNWFKLDPRK